MPRTERRLDERLGLDRIESADFIGVGTSLFDQMVADCRMPQPREINGRVVWDREELYAAFKVLPKRAPKAEDKPRTEPQAAAANPWDRGRAA